MTTADAGAPLVVSTPRTWTESLSRFWAKVRRLYRVLLPIRFSFITVAVLAFALIGNDQGHDAIAALAEGNATLTSTGNVMVRVGFLLLTPLFALMVWFWSRVFLRIQFPEQPDPAEFPRAVLWTPRLLGVAGFAVVFLSLWMVRGSYGGEVIAPRMALLWMALGVAAEALLFIAFVILRRRWLDKDDEARVTAQKEGVTSFGVSTQGVLHLTSVLGAVVLLGSIFGVQRLARIGSMSVLLLTLALWVSLGGIVVYWGMKMRVPILTWLAIFAIAISPLADNHRIQTIPNSSIQRQPTAVVFNSWYERLKTQYPSEAKRPVFIVATEGGGIRAAYWTAAVLTSLSDTVPGFTDHLFAVSSVSGGSLGAATHRALLADGTGPTRPKARHSLAYDALAPTLTAFTQSDFVQRFIPAPLLPDRAKALEVGWERGWTGATKNSRFSNGFLATTTAHADRLPSMFFNGTSVETGERIITSNALIDGSFADATDFFTIAGGDVKMSTGVDNSTRFPYISPAGTITSNGTAMMHVVDGGYFENSGAVTASELVRIVQQHPDAANIRPYVIFIRYQGIETPIKPETRANEVMSPIRTMLATRGAHGTVAVTQLARGTESTSFTLVQHPDEVTFPLGWLLAARTRDLIDKQMGPRSKENGANVRQIASVLGVQPARDVVWEAATRNEQQARAEEDAQ